MGRSYKFKGDVDYSFSKKKKPLSKEKIVKEPAKVEEKALEDSCEYEEWEEEGDFEKFDRKRW